MKNKQDKKIFVVPSQNLGDLDDKFTFMNHSNNVWIKYDTKGILIEESEIKDQVAFQQIVPFLIVLNQNENKVLIVRNKNDKTNTLSIGLKDNITDEDGNHQVVVKALIRMMWEHITTDPLTKATNIGIVRDLNSNDYNKVGLAFTIDMSEFTLEIKENSEYIGEWYSFEKIYENYGKFDNWSKYIIDYYYDKKKEELKLNIC